MTEYQLIVTHIYVKYFLDLLDKYSLKLENINQLIIDSLINDIRTMAQMVVEKQIEKRKCRDYLNFKIKYFKDNGCF